MKAYYHEHLSGYAQMKARGLESWGAVHGNPDFEEFSSRAFLEDILPRLQVEPGALVLELGCGTGPGSCWLARRGFRVHGIDLIPDAIEAARRMAVERGLDIRYEVIDMTQIPSRGEPYDLWCSADCPPASSSETASGTEGNQRRQRGRSRRRRISQP